tara:strand:- start:163 stop:3243 length:3081 start_codon:yes stop_codon:yes gene_type:complete
MKVKAFIEESLGNCSVPVDIYPHALKKRGVNFFNYCYNVHCPEGALDKGLLSDASNTLWDPGRPGILPPMLPGDLGLLTNARVSEEKVQVAKDRIGVATFPTWPPDLFAVTASLLERSGAYQRLRPVDMRFRSGGAYGKKEDWVRECFTQFDWRGKEPIDPESDDIFGVCGLNRYILRLIGLMWAHGALTVLLPGSVSNESDPAVIAKSLKESILKQGSRSNHALERFAKFFSNEIDEDLLAEFTVRLDEGVTDTYLLDKTGRHAKVDETDFVTGGINDQDNVYTRYLAHAAVNGCIRQSLANDDMDPAKYKETREHLLKQQRVPGLLKILWAVDYIQHQWSVLSNATDNLVPFNPKRLPVAGADPETIKGWEWCRAAIRLLIIADEASRAIGFSDRPTGRAMSLGAENPSDEDTDEIVPGSSCKLVWESFKKGYDLALHAHNDSLNPGEEPLLPLLPRTLTRCFDDELASVLPKARTSQVGCTIRSLSHNLALLPPRGRVRARWARSPSGAIRETLNILLVPFPYKLHTRDFRVSDVSQADEAPWGSFKVNPGWIYGYDDQLRPRVELPISLASRHGKGDDPYWQKPVRVCADTGACTRLFESAQAYSDYIDACHEQLLAYIRSLTDNLPGEDVNAIVFPEACLTYDAFDYLSKRLPRTLPELEIMVAGLCTAPKHLMALPGPTLNGECGAEDDGSWGDERVTGNFVATYLQNPDPVQTAETKVSRLKQAGACAETVRLAEEYSRNIMWPMRHIRGKHHRWCLDKRQLADYALSHRLAPNRSWWEDFDFLPREMLFCEFQSGSVLTALICEDLARIEPCQVALRAVGPNLVFVLLMDSAQVRGRWPHQYAGVLADDPGSSILTLTSFGLIERSSKSRDYTSRSIGMWREPDGETREIILPTGCHAQLLTLRSDYTEERTLDSRSDNGDSAIVWRFAGLTPIKADLPVDRAAGLDNDLILKNKILEQRVALLESHLDSPVSKAQDELQPTGDVHEGRGDTASIGTKRAIHAYPPHALTPPKFEFPD